MSFNNQQGPPQGYYQGGGHPPPQQGSYYQQQQPYGYAPQPSAPPAYGGYQQQPNGYGYQQPGGNPPQASGFNSRASMAATKIFGGGGGQVQHHGVPSSKVVIRISCRDLIKLDTFSESDPMCVVYGNSGNNWYEIGRTEVLKNSKNPNFSKSFSMDYFFEERQLLRFAVYDSDKTGHLALDKHDFIGQVETSLGSIVGASSGNFVRPLTVGGAKSKKSTKARGMIHLSAEEDPGFHNSGVVHIQFRGVGLDKKDFWGKSDPYLEIWRRNVHGNDILVHKTETVMKTLNPTWKKFNVPLSQLRAGDSQTLLKIKVYDWDSDGSHDFIGGTEVTFEQLESGAQQEFNLINPKKMPGGKKAKKGYKNSGVLQTMNFRVEQLPSFLDFLHSGLEIDFNIAIDFTGSNGNPSLPSSLHYLNPHQPNQYSMAISAIGNIIADYDNDQMFPLYGYGGKINGAVSHCFPLNPQQESVHGIPNVVATYEHAIRNVQLWGPTNFAPVIRQTITFAQNATMGKDYYVLLIITDGIITDKSQTIDAIVQASRLPMSIIIIGVGNEQFDDMEMLDGDEHVLANERGERAVRDIVQFVPYKNFRNNGTLLAQEVLAELPDQIVKYYTQSGYKPMKSGTSSA